MFLVTREIPFCYGHRLLNYDGKCKYLHGHNGTAVVSLQGEKLDHRGMLLDFGDIKRVLSRWIDEHLDHKLLLNREDPLIDLLRAQGEPLFVMDANPTAENIAKLIFDKAKEQGLPVVNVDLHETPNCFASYRE